MRLSYRIRVNKPSLKIVMFARTTREVTALRLISNLIPSSSYSPLYVDQFDTAPFGLYGLPRPKKGDKAILVLKHKV